MNKSGLFILIILYAAFISLGCRIRLRCSMAGYASFLRTAAGCRGNDNLFAGNDECVHQFGAGWLRKRLSIAAVLIVSTF